MAWWHKTKPALETAEHVHFIGMVLDAVFGWHTWLAPMGTSVLMLFIAAADPKSWSVTEVIFYALGAGAIVAVFMVAVLVLVQLLKHGRDARGDEQPAVNPSAAVLSISGPHLLKDARYQNKNQWRMNVHSAGPAAARNVQMKLRRGAPGPKDPTWTGDYPYPVYPVGTIANDPTHTNATGRQINADDDEMYEIVCGWKSEYGQLFTDLNTKGGGHNLIQIAPGELWKLFYEVTAENVPSIKFTLHIFVENDQIKAIRIG